MATCDRCGATLEAPRECSYCGDQLCGDHRLPEAHDCPKVEDDGEEWFDPAFDSSASE